MDISKEIGSIVDAYGMRDKVYNPYYFWEPFDCIYPSKNTIRTALEDGVDLLNDETTELAGDYPRKFQSGFVTSEKKVACIQAGTQVGKSISNFMILGAALSKQPPYCLRYEEGADTGVQRVINNINVRRFGRHDSVTGELIDYDENAILDPQSWNCGNITGIGLFPKELYCPDGGQIWIGTLARSIDTYWWLGLTGRGSQRFLPQEFVDLSRGNKGSDKQIRAVYGPRDTTIFVKSYDSEPKVFESQSSHLLLFDEEPPNPAHYSAGVLHSKYQRWSFTPFEGVTYSYGLFYGCISEKARDIAKEKGIGSLDRQDFDYFSGSAYDSPYVEREALKRNRLSFPMWERKARIWGRYSEQLGEPFFDRNKLDVWARKYSKSYKLKKFTARHPYMGITGNIQHNVRGILDTDVTLEDAEKKDQYAWRIYEPVMPNVGYLAIFDAAEGAVNPELAADKSFGLIVRAPLPTESVEYMDVPVIVASTRTTLPTVAFARSVLPVLHYYNDAVLAPERGHGKDNEAFGLTIEEWPYWYYTIASTSGKTRKGFDTHTTSRTAIFDKLQDWVGNFTIDEDPHIYDSWIYKELCEAIMKKTVGGKHKCDHPKSGSLDGVICLGIATYIYQETPEHIVCNRIEEQEERMGFIQRMGKNVEEDDIHVPFGSGIGNLGGR